MTMYEEIEKAGLALANDFVRNILGESERNAAKIAKKAFKENITLKEAALKLDLISESEFNKIVLPKKMI